MDILSIRKKKKAAEAAEARSSTAVTPPSSTSLPQSSTSLPQPSSTSLPQPSTSLPQPATTIPQPASTSLPQPATTIPQPAPRGRVTPDDPLREFLASYDDDDGAHDFGGDRTRGQEATERFLTFRLEGESYAASIMDVREILKVRSLTDVPRAPRSVLGVISKRGVVLPVVDLAVLLGLRVPDRRLSVAQRVLVVGDGDRVCGLRVDAVAEVIKLSSEQIEGVPPSLGARNAGLLVGLGRVDDAMHIVLDLAAVLDAFATAQGLPPARREATQ